MWTRITKFKILLFLSLVLCIIAVVSNNFKDKNVNLEIYHEKTNIEINGSWVLTTAIHVDDTIPSMNWSKTAADNPWCSGTGTWSDPYTIENVTIDGLFEGSCIFIENSDVPFVIRNCTLINIGSGANPNHDSGIRLNIVTNGLLINNTCSFNNGRGIRLQESSNITVCYNKANYNKRTGLNLVNGMGNKVIGNCFNYNHDGGIYVSESSYNNFSRNIIIQSMSDFTRMIELTGQNNNFSENLFYNCSIHLELGLLDDLSSHQIDTTNLVNGKPIYYYTNVNGLSKENFTNAGQIILVGCDNCEISSIDMMCSGPGISLYYCDQNLIFNNSLNFHYHESIQLYASTHNNVSNNIINTGNQGINIRESSDNNISSNQIDNCEIGIQLMASYWNTVDENCLYHDFQGIIISHGSSGDLHNIIKKNIISNSDNIGISISNMWANGNILYLNEFTNNIQNCRDYADNTYWDNGTIGNYWDDYNGNDTNDDGIGDTPYLVPGDGGNQDNFPIWDDGFNGSKIIIDDSASNDWNWASKHTWCSGSGTASNPYVISGVEIDANNFGSCIFIKNSNVHFNIESCTVYNSQDSDLDHAGIRLQDTTNGVISNCNILNNNGEGITLDGCHDINIQGCTINNNRFGISQIWSTHTITIINNTFRNNDRGIFMSSNGRNDQIFNNIFEDNSDGNLYLNPGSFIVIQNNTITGGAWGIHLWGDNNTISYNNIHSCTYGIRLINGMETWDNVIANNSIQDNIYGIKVDGANCRYNLFYNNSFTNYNFNALDDGYSNDWNNSNTGNYWDDYGGMDANDDGIGDSSYIINGLANSYDDMPIFWDAPKINVTFPSQYALFESPPNFEISIEEGIVDTTWYTLDNGITNLIFTGLTGIINETAWNKMPNGTVKIDFYANDSKDYTTHESLTVCKDVLPPIITVFYPHPGDQFGFNAPYYYLSIVEFRLDSIWYSFDYGMTIFPLYSLSGTLDQVAWEMLDGEMVTIRFYANDSLGHESFIEVNVTKDITAPIITINDPNNDDVFNGSPPNYNIDIIEDNMGTIWYTLNEENIFPNASCTGTLDENIWITLPEGPILITFYANDIVGNIGFAQVTVYKDSIAPVLIVDNPENEEIFDISPPFYNLTILEDNIDTIWYTLDNGENNITIMSLTGTINENTWNSLPDGLVYIKFYVSDIAGNIGFDQVTIYKNYIVPLLIITSPESGIYFSTTPPNYTLSIVEESVETIWYTMDDGENNFTIISLTGTMDENTWNALPEGRVVITFYFRDIARAMGFAQVTIYKDSIAPVMSINEPDMGDEFTIDVPIYDIDVMEENLYLVWYTMNEGQNITIITAFTDFINEDIWNSLPNGAIKITFYANDTAGNLGFDTIIIYKNTPSDNQPFIPGPNSMLILLMMFSSIVYIIRRSKNKMK